MSRSCALLELQVPCDPQAPAVVRKALSGLEEIAPVRDDAQLVASELVTNAVLHSGCDDEQNLQVCVTCSSDAVLISVADPGTSGAEAQPSRRQSQESIGGWGLRLVGQLASRWGSERPGGLRVWAELGLTS